MKKYLNLILTIVIILPTLANARSVSTAGTVRGVYCDENKECTVEQMRIVIESLKKAKADGEAAKNSDPANKIAKGLVIVGGSWFLASAAVIFINGTTSIRFSGLVVDAAIPGIVYGGAAAVAGGLILAFTPSSTEDGTLSNYYSKDKNISKLLDLETNAILDIIAFQNTVLGNKLVTLSAVLASVK